MKNAPVAKASGTQTMVRIANDFLFIKLVLSQLTPPIGTKSPFEQTGFDTSHKFQRKNTIRNAFPWSNCRVGGTAELLAAGNVSLQILASAQVLRLQISGVEPK